MTAPPKLSQLRLVLGDDGSTNSVAGATASEILEGYTFILTQMKAYFGVPIEFFMSGSPENWQQQWDYPSKADRATAHKERGTV